MTDCDEVLRDLEVYVDGELPAYRARAIEVHLSGCSPCFQRGEFRRALRDIVRRKSGSADLPPALDERVRRLLGFRPGFGASGPA